MVVNFYFVIFYRILKHAERDILRCLYVCLGKRIVMLSEVHLG